MSNRIVNWCYVGMLGGITLVCSGSYAMEPANTEKVLREAIDEYQSAMESTDRDERLERFYQSELLFRKLCQPGESDFGIPINNPDLQVNIGNAALGAERLGSAILAYRRALIMQPTHHRAGQNLAHVRTLLPAWLPKPEVDSIIAATFRLPLFSSGIVDQWIAIVCFLLASTAVGLRVAYPHRGFTVAVWITLSLWISLMGLLGFSKPPFDANLAVVVVPEVIARSADSSNAPSSLPGPLPAGTELSMMEQRGDWLRVRLFDSSDVWVTRSSITPVLGDTK
ncbi:MAG: hypothetical protein VX435_04805, partial [Planctomycetota bacterium]|nr:hypothetical protein [Planctomycetota bacterium]